MYRHQGVLTLRRRCTRGRHSRRAIRHLRGPSQRSSDGPSNRVCCRTRTACEHGRSLRAVSQAAAGSFRRTHKDRPRKHTWYAVCQDRFQLQ
jgi:hypothetical protein